MMVMMMILTYIMLQESILQYSLVLFMCAKQSGKEILDTVVFWPFSIREHSHNTSNTVKNCKLYTLKIKNRLLS